MKKMRATVLPFPAKITDKTSRAESFRRLKSVWTAASFAFAAIGLLLFVGGVVVSLMAYLETGFYTTMNSRIGGLLLFAAFPACFFAAHALDKISFYKRAEKLETTRSFENSGKNFR